jgi:hypothetical protein
MRITPLNRKNARQVLRLLAQLDEAPFRPAMVNRWRHGVLGLDGICRALGLQRWGWPALHAVSQEGTVLAVSWLVRDSLTLPRWRIEQLVVAPDTVDTVLVGTQLLNYVISQYGAQGAQTFVAFVDHRFEQALALLKACGFRQATRRHVFQVRSSQLAAIPVDQTNDPPPQWQEVGLGQSSAIYSLLKASLPSALHGVLLPSRCDWLGQRLVYRGGGGQRQWTKAWAIDLPVSSSMNAKDTHSKECGVYLALRSEGSPQEQGQAAMHLTLYCHPLLEAAWLPGVLARCGAQLLKAGGDPVVSINVYDYETALTKTLETAGAQWVSVTQILEKNYWQPADPTTEGLKHPILLLANKVTPACS